MSWAPGDLALCVRSGTTIQAGEVHRVERVIHGGVSGALGLVLEGKRSMGSTLGYHVWRFVKITPGADINGFEEPRRVPVKEEV